MSRLIRICIRLRAPRLLRPSCESPASRLRVERHRAVEAGLCFRCLELCPCFHLVKPSSCRRVAVALLLTRSRAPRLLRPSRESPASRLRVERHRAVEAGLCFRCLELCPCFLHVKPSSCRRVPVALLLTRSRAPRLLRPSSKLPGCASIPDRPS